jgi:gamma-glutamylcyclotransferase (GGCT)/AIG2-like uncharacterized protein YtfP
MKDRCPSANPIAKVKLKGFQFLYDGFSKARKGPVANVIQSPGSTVWGGLYEIDPACLKSLDRFEGYPKRYTRKTVEVHDHLGRTSRAWMYFRTGERPGHPSNDYQRVVIQGAQDWNLPEVYIKTHLEKGEGHLIR